MKRAFLSVPAWLWAAAAVACPFCGAVAPSLAERRDAAEAVAVGEAEGGTAADAAGRLSQRFRLDQLLRGTGKAAAGDVVPADVAGAVAGTAVLFGQAGGGPDGAGLRWSAVPADEMLLGHVAAAPASTVPAVERLRWFAGRLEHPDAAIAADAFAEFGRAPFADVRAAADRLDAAALRAWVTEPGIDGRRRGLYGLLLGIVAARADDPATAEACVAALRRAVEAPADDFRAGFDGVLAGVLVAEGPRGLDYLRRRGLLAADARPLDQRHLLAAVRFAWESLADTIPRERLVAATADVSDRPAVAAEAITDLARYAAWEHAERIARLWDGPGREDPLVRRAIAGFLAACPLPAAAQQLQRLRSLDPDRLKQALDAAALPR